MEVIELEGMKNVRDLGGIPVSGGRAVASGLFYRGSALGSSTERDREALFGRLGIRCVIDVRCGWERDESPDPSMPGVENLHIPFYDLEKVGIEYTEPAEGTKVVGRDVACDPERFYRSLANPLTVAQMRTGVHAAFGRAERGTPVYIHCSGGKDRAGIMALLVLTVLGASDEDILADYLFTNVARDADYEQAYQRFLRLADGDGERARELTRAHRARPDNIAAFKDEIARRYRSMDSFVRDQLGIDDADREHIRATCTVSSIA